MKRKSISIAIAVLAIGLSRILLFGEIPPSLNRDEAALGYNAFSILTEGTDEWGVSYPVLFRSFGDYKLPGYIYTLVPFVSVLGVQDWVIRLPSLVAGFAIVMLTYGITKTITSRSRLATLSAIMVGLSPWAIFYSRMAWEAHLALAWLLLSVFFILRYSGWLSYVGFFLSYFMAVMTYNTPLLLAPAMVYGLLLLPRSILNKQQRISFGLITLVIAVLGYILFLPAAHQKQQITIFSDPAILLGQNEQYASAKSFIDRVIAHRFIDFSKRIGKNVLASLSTRFLVFQGGNHPWHSLPGEGHLLLIEYVLMILGAIAFVWRNGKRLLLWTIFLGLLLLPAVITVDAPHATRSLAGLWLAGVVAGYGMDMLFSQRRLLRVVVALLILESVYYIYRYFYVFPQSIPPTWPTGLAEAFEGVAREEQVLITNGEDSHENLYSSQVYIYALLYTQTPASEFYSSVIMKESDNAGLVQVAGFEGVVIANSLDEVNEAGNFRIIERYLDGHYELE